MSSKSGLYESHESGGIGHDGFWRLERETNGPIWNLQSAQILHQIPTPLDVSTKYSSLPSSALGLYESHESGGIGQDGFWRLERETNGPIWNLQSATNHSSNS